MALRPPLAYNAEVERPPQLKTILANGLELALWDWPGEAPALLFAHATGFHGRCWDRIAGMFPGQRRLSVDFRGHGRSAKPEPPYHWDAFGCDLAAVARELDLTDAIGVGHSMGGHSVVLAACLRPKTFRALLLIDPTIFPPDYYSAPALDAGVIRRRRNHWKSPGEMFERFRQRPPFALWKPEILRDYCEFGLLPQDGGYVLACPPAVEASIYEHSNAPEANLYPAIPSLHLPVVVMRAGIEWKRDSFDLASSPTAPDLAAKFRNGREVLLKNHDHFIPMASPDAVAEQLSAF